MLLILASRYDAVTARTLAIAQSLREAAQAASVEVTALFETDATEDSLRRRLGRSFRVFAVYTHGDRDGRLLGQDRIPLWSDDSVPDFHQGALVAHACRAMLTLDEQFKRLGASVIVGYRVDLMLPPDGGTTFWDLYRHLHVLFPRRLAQGCQVPDIRDEFYRYGTDAFAQLNQQDGSLIELIALQQSRDDLVIRTRTETRNVGGASQ
jgi:hypothetical protein